MMSELLMNPCEYYHDNRQNNFNSFTIQMLNTKNKYYAFVLDWMSGTIDRTIKVHFSHRC